MACSSSSNGRNVSSADGFRRTTKTMKNFWKRIGSYWEDAVANNTLPDQSEEEEWSVWLVKPNQMFKHHSLLIESTDKGGSFTIELLVNVETKEVVPESRPLDRNDPRYSDLLTFNHLGNITTSAESLFRKAMDCLENFGPYDEITNNCQGYCQVYNYCMCAHRTYDYYNIYDLFAVIGKSLWIEDWTD